MDKPHERGIAIVLALFLMSAMSVLAASMMFLSQTETYASMNYRMMSQARYAGESAVQQAANFLLDSNQYTLPTATDPLFNPATCNYQVSPVTCGGNPVVLSANLAAKSSNYPTPAVQTAFENAAKGTMWAGGPTVDYSAYATLLSMQKFESYGGGTAVVQTWEITGIGSLGGARTATVEVNAQLETPKVPATSYAAFAQANGCGALTFQGNVDTDSYDSTSMSGATSPTFSGSGGDVATNGNLTLGGSSDINGNLYTPRAGVGDCTEGTVTALDENGGADVNGSIVQLPASVTYPTPPLPTAWQDSTSAQFMTLTSTTVAIDSSNVNTTACASLLAFVATCTVTGSGVGAVVTVTGGGNLPNITVSNQIVLQLTATSPAAQYDLNSINLNGNASVRVKANSSTESVVMNVAGKNSDGTDMSVPIDFTGGTFASPSCGSCSSYDASLFQIVYAGTGEVKMQGNNDAAAVLYAPNSNIELSGSANFYGSMLGKTIDDTGGANFYYDRRLQRDFYVAGHPMASTFNWKRY